MSQHPPPRPTPLTDKFIYDLRVKMQETGITKSALARMLGKSRQYMTFWFSQPRKRSPNSEAILKIQQEIIK